MSFYETHETHSKEALRTRWYRCTFEEIKNAIRRASEQLGYEILDFNQEYKEFLLENGNVSLVIHVSSYGGYEQGVDFNIDTNTFFDFGKGKRLISKFYEKLGTIVTLKGVSLHP